MLPDAPTMPEGPIWDGNHNNDDSGEDDGYDNNDDSGEDEGYDITTTVAKMKLISMTMKKVTEPVSPTTPGLAGWSRAKAAT